MKKCGYELVFKPTIKDHNGKLKGNVDAELVLTCAAIEFDNFDKAVIVSGDGDYRCLLEFLENKGKLLTLIIPNPKSESSLLKAFQKYKVFIQAEKNKLELIPAQPNKIISKSQRKKYKRQKKWKALRKDTQS